MPVVAKIFDIQDDSLSTVLAGEAGIYRTRLEGVTGVPEMYGYFRDDYLEILVMSVAGRPIETAASMSLNARRV
jgi:hypothetical protein